MIKENVFSIITGLGAIIMNLHVTNWTEYTISGMLFFVTGMFLTIAKLEGSSK